MANEIVRIFTIGYQGRTFAGFRDILITHGVSLVIDIRANAFSRNKAFSKKNLAYSLKQANIAYQHFQQLGTPLRLRRAIKESGDYGYFFAEYEKYLITQTDTLNQLYNLLNDNEICLMCYERDPRQCHRLSVSQKLLDLAAGKKPAEIKHL